MTSKAETEPVSPGKKIEVSPDSLAGGNSPRRRWRTASSAPVRLSDVALRAGVSPGTVSRVLHQPSIVSPKLRAAVEAAIDQLGWVPNGAARALAMHRTRTIGLIIPTVAHPIFARMVYTIQHRLMANSYIMIIGCSEYDPGKALAEARTMVGRGVDGLIVLGGNYPDEFWQLLRVQGIPSIITYSYRRDSGHVYVGIDNYRAAFHAPKHLLGLGHTKFAVIAQNLVNNDRAEQRLQAVLDVLGLHGHAPRAEHILQKPWSIAEGRIAFQEIWSKPPRPTAIICTNDYLAVGAIAAAHEAGLSVPDDISVVGFDDLEIAAYINPPLTTVCVPAEEIGEAAAGAILGLIEKNAAARSTEFEVRFVVRNSTGPAPNHD